MGCYAELKLGSVTLGHSKNYPDPFLLSLFQEEDKVITDTTLGEYGFYGDLGEQENGEPITVVQYSCPVAVVRDRLEIMGFNRPVAKKGFNKGLEAEISRSETLSDALPSEFRTITADVLKNLTPEDWLDALLEIDAEGLSGLDVHDHDELTPILRYMLIHDWYGFPGHDYRHFLRLVIDNYPDDELLVYDLTDLVQGRWVDEADELIELLEEEIVANYSERRAIIATEGKTDALFLSRSIKLLYPHISDFFRFLDFETSKFAGGSGTLANLTKAFVGVGASNRLIALFDNDTAAEEALTPVHKIQLPDNILVLRYPYLDLASSYPTLGPSGLEYMDVNGLAGSLELYLGVDCLKDDSGELTPVQWKGYKPQLNKYQGEIIDKKGVQERFKSKLDACEADPDLIKDYDWSGIRLIIDRLRCAFQEQDARDILEDTERY